MSLLDAFRRLDAGVVPPGEPLTPPPPCEVIAEAMATHMRTGAPRFSVTDAPPRGRPCDPAGEATPPMVSLPLEAARRLLAAADYVAEAYAELVGVTPRVKALSVALGGLETAVETVLARNRLPPLPAEVMAV